MASARGEGSERVAPLAYLPGARVEAPVAPVAPVTQVVHLPEGEPRARRSRVAFAEEYWADGELAEEQVLERVGDRDPTDVPADDDPAESDDRASVIASATATLTRSLGRRGLSIAEARSKLRATDLTAEEAEDTLEDFIRRGWLDDAVLAEQLVHSATTRKDMGTRAVRQLLQKRMLVREVIDQVIDELPDDDAERALEFATTKARSMIRYDDETATRRLMGMLARRGFGGSAASTAARTALAAARREAGGGSGVRFR